MTDPLVQPEALARTSAEDAVAFASGLVREWCGWHIAPSRADTVRLNGDGTTLLLLPSLRVTDVARVATAEEGDLIDVAWGDNGVLARTGSSEFAAAWTAGNVYMRPKVFPAGVRNVTVEFTHGWDATPPAVQAVVVAVARRVAGGNVLPVVQEAAGGLSRMFGGMARSGPAASAAFTAVEAMVLNRYRLPTVA